MVLHQFTKNLTRSFYRHTSEILRVVLYALSKLMMESEDQYDKIVAECSALTASGFWLDFWGYLLSVTRFTFEGETDEVYRRRIFVLLRQGVSTREALINAVANFSLRTPELIEHNGTIVKNMDYADYEANFDRHVMTLIFVPMFSGFGTSTFYTNISYLGYNTYLTRRRAFHVVALTQIYAVVEKLKTAGVKLIHKVGGV